MAAADENETNKLLLRLPDDVVSDILSRLAPRGMAVSRSVCKSWRDVVDSRRLLRAHLLPLSVAGIFFRHTGADILFPPLFFDGASSTAISDGILARFGNDYTSYTYLHDHCNGLLLINNCWRNHKKNGGHLRHSTCTSSPRGLSNGNRGPSCAEKDNPA
ncbi:hypothetical protein QOZ80_8AG0641140 [Eleusine coracana subsp. coracana]|nr:hypothetical protein QOZ80_8AG0640640 [Eleusine coracana subsp. coracana]KAK3124147.1 hypothetical protein QOZ80_8AG0641140 [Eleusine coracana subsp. coracana]